MKITITIEDKKKNKNRIIRIPVSKEELRVLTDIAWFMAGKEFEKWFKLNKINPKNIFRKIWFATYDILDEGKVYNWNPDTKKSKLCKERWYLIKKPKWTNGKLD